MCLGGKLSKFINTDGHTQLVIRLRIKPYHHQTRHTLTGSALSPNAGAVLYGHYDMEYLLPHGDKLHLIANHDKKTVQLLLFTHDAELIKLLPGPSPSSLVAAVLSTLNLYRLKASSYKPPLTLAQQQKLQVANTGIAKLSCLLTKERSLAEQDYQQQEALRQSVITIIVECQNNNRLIADNPTISEGHLGSLLYDAYKIAQHYEFNRVYPTSYQDQMDFHQAKDLHKMIMWDSELHLDNSPEALDNTLRVLCDYYQLTPIKELNNLPANRFAKMHFFLQKLWRDSQEWMASLTQSQKSSHKIKVITTTNGLSITQITPYYILQGVTQKGYANLNDFARQFTTIKSPLLASSVKEAQRLLEPLPNGHWVIIRNKNLLIIRVSNQLCSIGYFIQENQFYPLPDGQDLYTLCQLSRRSLYWPERLQLKLKAFISYIPVFFLNFYHRISYFIGHELQQDFLNHVHHNHKAQLNLPKKKDKTPNNNILYEALKAAGFLTNGLSLEAFIKKQLNNSPYIVAQANHPPSPPAYDNPLHRTLALIRHVAGFFIDTSERNPTVGLLALAAYFYGAGAVLAPNKLAELLTKLHLQGLIAGIEPTQKFAHLLNHGRTSEAISASAAYWQGMVTGGNLDKFFINAIDALKNDPADIAIIACLALSLGYGMTKIVPALENEMGEFPYTNYAALGGKGGAALYDTIMHPGEDWLLGTCKWFFKTILISLKITIAPFIEGYHYGYKNGFIKGWKKSLNLARNVGKQTLAASLDLLWALATIPLIELSAMLIHMPFRGVTNVLRKILASLGNLTGLADLLVQFALRPAQSNLIADFKLSKLYGFSSPLGYFSDNFLINLALNLCRCIFLPTLQLAVNVILLPSIDLLSLLTRIMLTLLNPLTRLGAYGLGISIKNFGLIWDPSFGQLFLWCATTLSHICNGLDMQLGEIKGHLLSVIQIQRKTLYHWAFAQEDKLNHKVIQDEHYYCDPHHYELLPHSESHCLLNHLIGHSKKKPTPAADTQASHFKAVFQEVQTISQHKQAESYSMSAAEH